MSVALSPDESLDALTPTWDIVQLKRGHRFSTDDLATAWRASLARPQARTVLDMGCGVGSVGLSTLYRLPDDARLVAIEAQAISVALYRKTIAHNGLDDRVTLHEGDLRDGSVLPEGATFELVTGSPPYVPVGNGVISPHPQKAGARMELRGSVFDYCRAAKRWLAPEGRFAFVMLAQDPRTEAAPVEAGLAVVERWDYVFGAQRTPHIATMVCAHAEEGPFERVTGTLAIRGPAGEWTAEYREFQRAMGRRSPR